MAQGDAESAEVLVEDARDDGASGAYPKVPEWAFTAWRTHLAGVSNWDGIARQVGVFKRSGRPDGEKVKRQVTKLKRLHAQLRDAENIEEATEDYIEGKTMDLRDADRLVRNADNDNAKIAALKARSSFRDDIAAARGVPTQRRAKVAEGEPVEIAAPKDVVAVIQQAMNDAQGIENPGERARTLGNLSVVALKGLQDADLAARIEALEEAVETGARGRGR